MLKTCLMCACVLTLLGYLFFMDTVSRHALISLKMANEEDVLLDLSENVIEVKSAPKRKGNKVRTRRWTDEETDIREVAKTNKKKSGQGVSENYNPVGFTGTDFSF